MLYLLLLVGSAVAEFSVRMPYLNPAGVTYTSHLAAYGPLAYSGYAAGPLAAPIAATGYAAQPIAVAPVAPRYTPVVGPASAVVPVTRVSAQPAVVQKVVDVAQPSLATRRYQIRRPAIQKQFYDIEERIVVRPAGSAIVELEQPISTNQRGPTEIRPAAPVPQALLRYTGKQTFQIAAPAGTPTYLPIPAVHEPSAEYEEFIHQQELVSRPIPPQVLPQPEYPQQPIPQPQFPQQPFPQPQFPQQPIPQPQFPQQPIPQPQFPQQPIPQPQFPQQPIPQPQFPQQPIPPQPFPGQGPQQEQPQLDTSDSVSIENPELVRGNNNRAFRPQFDQQQPQLPQFETSESALFQSQRPRFSGDFPERTDPTQVVDERQEPPRAFSRARIEELGSVAVPSVQPDPPRARALLRPEISPSQAPTGPTPLTEIQSTRHLISPEQTNENQRRLIELLTARGPVSEVSSPVRARVLSVTPAPSNGPQTDSQTNTRRVVVNRPIQTVQDVEVVQPITKVDRVAVHQPTLVKTAHVELAHIPALHAVTPVPYPTQYL